MSDRNLTPEANFILVPVVSPEASFIAYQNDIEVLLDPGMVLHKPLPQQAYEVDSLTTPPRAQVIGPYDYNAESFPGGINIQSHNQTQRDVVQRMATSTYRFCLHGFGMRAGYRVPIPGLFSVNGVTPTPDKGSWARETVRANAAGIPIYSAVWKLNYIVAIPPSGTQLLPPPPNLAAHIRGDAILPQNIFPPISVPEVGVPKILTPVIQG